MNAVENLRLLKKIRDALCALSVFLLICSLIWTAAFAAPQPNDQNAAFQSKAKQIYMIEAESGTVLLAAHEDDQITPASLSKLMTVEYVLSQIKSGALKPETEFKVSENAWRTGGALSRTATMFAALKSSISVSDLLKGAIIPVANDGCIILAEGIAGSEPAFTELLNKRALELGLTKSVFANSTGLPDPKAKTSVKDLVTLARRIIAAYPEFYSIYAIPDFEWNKIAQRNRNPLISQNMNVDGLVTGYAEDSGYGIVASINRDGTRLILAMSGLASEKERMEEAKRVLEWGVSTFQSRKLFDANQVIASASVYGGANGSVGLVSQEPVNIFLAKVNPERLAAKVIYHWPLRAPIKKGQQVGTLVISSGERPLREQPLYTSEDVEQGTMSSRAIDAVKELIFFWL